MAKKGIMLYIESSIYENFKMLYHKKVSEKIEAFMSLSTDSQLSTPEAVDKSELLKEREELLSKIEESKLKLSETLEKINTVEKIQKEKEEERKKMEEQNALKFVQCLVCKEKKLHERMHKFEMGMICHACFITTSAKDLRIFNRTEEINNNNETQ